jgi:small subunit ribosomal protein S2
VIPGNDDAIRSGTLLCRVIADAVIEGKHIASLKAPTTPRSADDGQRVAAEQAEARRLALLEAQQRESRVAAGRPAPRPAPVTPVGEEPLSESIAPEVAEAEAEAGVDLTPEPAAADEAAPADTTSSDTTPTDTQES